VKGKAKVEKPFKCVTLVGSGFLGSQIAMVAAYAGYKVKIYDPQENAFVKTYDKIHSDLQMKGVTPFVPWEKWEECRDSIEQTMEIGEAVKDAQLVIEVAPEIEDLKKSIFKQLGELTSSECILATNSSSMPVSRFEEISGRPERCLNLHFYLPLQGMNMADVMGGSKTLPEVIEAGRNFIRSLGDIPLTVKKEILGFCFNRVWRAIKKETLYMWGNGFVDHTDIDRAWMIFTGMKMGPFALMDSVGLDVVHDIEMVYANESKDSKDVPPKALKDMIDKGDLGVKSGKGFYTYPNPDFLDPNFLKP